MRVQRALLVGRRGGTRPAPAQLRQVVLEKERHPSASMRPDLSVVVLLVEQGKCVTAGFELGRRQQKRPARSQQPDVYLEPKWLR